MKHVFQIQIYSVRFYITKTFKLNRIRVKRNVQAAVEKGASERPMKHRESSPNQTIQNYNDNWNDPSRGEDLFFFHP